MFVVLVSLAAAPQAVAQGTGGADGQAEQRSEPTAEPSSRTTGGAAYGEDPAELPRLTVPGDKAVLMDNGLAAAPEMAPSQVKAMIWAANELQDKPYRYGGGHARVKDTGYDCSGTVSYALIRGGALKRPLDSSSFMRYGARGPGRWVTIYTNPGHAYVVIAGLRLDTSAAGARGGKGPRWRATGRPTRGYKVRHPVRL